MERVQFSREHLVARLKEDDGFSQTVELAGLVAAAAAFGVALAAAKWDAVANAFQAVVLAAVNKAGAVG